MKNSILRKLLLLTVLLTLVVAVLAGCGEEPQINLNDLPDADPYTYHNPDAAKAEPDPGITIDGVLDEEIYQGKNWMWLHNDDGGNNVTIGITSHWGEKGMYFVYDVTESVPIYVNLDRASYMNSCIEMYLAPSYVTSRNQNSYFEIDMLPTGNLNFKMSNGRDTYSDVTTTYDKMAVLGATTKGGEVNTPDCYGYNLELFIPWEYMNWLGMDVDSMKDGFVYINPAHITSNNLNGTDSNLDRMWYHYAQQQGADFSQIYQYFRFDGDGAMGVVPVTVEKAEGCTVSSDPTAVFGVETILTVKPENGKAVTSFVVNGEEKIGLASFNEDGAAYVVVRAGDEAVTISAAAADIAAGPYTVTGKIDLKRYSGKDTLENTILTYTGPQGEKPIEFAADGSFKVEGLAEGNYVITCEKDGYIKHTRNITVNRNMEISVLMEYDQFYIEKGTSWILDNQNDGYLGRFSGDQSYVMTNDSYDDFTLTGRMHFAPEVVSQKDVKVFQEQRAGLRMRFDNGKTLHVDVVYQNGQYIIQYAKIHNTALISWKTITKLTEKQIEKLLSPEGLALTVMRQNHLIGVFLEDEVVDLCEVDDSIYNAKCQLGFENWAANMGMYQMEYEILDRSEVPLYTAFKPGAYWNTRKMFKGVITTTGRIDKNMQGDSGWLNSFMDVYSGITVQLRDYTPQDKNYRAAVNLLFENGKQFCITVTNANGRGYELQYMNMGIVENWSAPYRLTPEQTAKITSQNDHLAFKVINVGHYANVYLDDVQVLSVDISKDTSGNATGIDNTPATVGVRIYGNSRIRTDVPYQFHMTPTPVQVNLGGSHAKDANVGSNHILGETVSVRPANNTIQLNEVLVDGEKMEIGADGTVRFTASKEIHNVEIVDAERIYDWITASNWNLDNQGLGSGHIIAGLPGSKEGDSGFLNSAVNTYRDVSILVKDSHPDAAGYRSSIRFNFTNGKNIWVSILEQKTDSYIVQTMTDSITPAWKNLHTLTAEEAKIVREGGIFRVSIVGNTAVFRLNELELCTLDLTAGNVAGVGAQIQLRMFGVINETMPMDYTLGGEPTTYKITFKNGRGCYLSTHNTVHFAGDNVVINTKMEEGYVDPVLKVNGQVVELVNGKYTIENLSANTTVELSATVTDEVKDFLTVPAVNWDLTGQGHGSGHIVASLPGSGAEGDSGYVTTVRNNYRDVTLFIKDDDVDSKIFRSSIKFNFANGKNVWLSILEEKNRYIVQSLSGGIPAAWKNWHTLTAEEVAAVRAGAEFRIFIVGNEAIVRLNGKDLCIVDLSAGNVAGVGAEIQLRNYGPKGTKAAMDYKLGGEPKVYSVTKKAGLGCSLEVSNNNKYVLPGESFVVTAKLSGGFIDPVLKVNGEAVELTDGKYTVSNISGNVALELTATQTEEWDAAGNQEIDFSKQKEGIITLPNSDGASGWAWTFRNDYRDMSFQVKHLIPGETGFGLEYQLKFANGKWLCFRLTNADDSTGTNYKIQTMDKNTMISNWANLYKLSAQQNKDMTTGDGVNFRVAVSGNTVIFLIDGVRVHTIDLSAHNIAGVGFQPVMYMRGNKGKDFTVNYKLGGEPELAKLNIASDIEDGTVTASSAKPLVGEVVTITGTPSTANPLRWFVIDGEKVTASNGKYTFTTSKTSYDISANFVPDPVWVSTNTEWDVSQQKHGRISVKGVDNDTGWLEAVNSNYKEISIHYTAVKEDTFEQALSFRLMFSNGKTSRFRLICDDKNNYSLFRLQHMGDNDNMVTGTGWGNIYRLTTAQNAKLYTDGCTITVRVMGNDLVFFLDGVRVATYDLSDYGLSGLTFKPSLRSYNAAGVVTPMTFSLSQSSLSCSLDADTSKVRVAASPANYLPGESVKLTLTAKPGYKLTGLKVDGAEVTLSGNTYTFTTTKDQHKIEPICDAEAVWNSATNWNISNQTAGVLKVTMPAPNANGESDSTGINTKGNNLREFYITAACEPENVAKESLSYQFRVDLTGGKKLRFRFINGRDNGNTFIIQKLGNSDNLLCSSASDWGTIAVFPAELSAKALAGEEMTYGMKLDGNKVLFMVNGQCLATVDLSSQNIAQQTFALNLRIYTKGYTPEINIKYTVG